jgi:hypothetical protein
MPLKSLKSCLILYTKKIKKESGEHGFAINYLNLGGLKATTFSM